MSRIYKILPRADWQAAVAAGVYAGSPVDHADGFIHFSTAVQAAETARKHFSGQRDLVVLELESEEMSGIKWEPSRGGDLFPHLYGTFDPAVVLAVHEAPLGADGAPQIGALA